MNPKIILVTGATGQQGGAVAKHLLEKGWRLRALVRDPEKPSAISLHEKGVEIIINRILGSQLSDEYKNNLKTEVSAEMEPDTVSTGRYSSPSLFNYIFLTVLLILTVINTAMLFGFIFSRFIKF